MDTIGLIAGKIHSIDFDHPLVPLVIFWGLMGIVGLIEKFMRRK